MSPALRPTLIFHPGDVSWPQVQGCGVRQEHYDPGAYKIR